MTDIATATAPSDRSASSSADEVREERLFHAATRHLPCLDAPGKATEVMWVAGLRFLVACEQPPETASGSL
jgi:hypothetical protein